MMGHREKRESKLATLADTAVLFANSSDRSLQDDSFQYLPNVPTVENLPNYGFHGPFFLTPRGAMSASRVQQISRADYARVRTAEEYWLKMRDANRSARRRLNLELRQGELPL
jgi:hypothetical protein